MSRREYLQIDWSDTVAQHARHLVELALSEDLHGSPDWTTESLVPKDAAGEATITSRQQGVIAGARVLELVARAVDTRIKVDVIKQDGSSVVRGDVVAKLSGPARGLLIAE